MSVSFRPAARRRSVAGVAAAALAFAGLAITAPAADAAVNPTVTVTPSPLTPGAVQNVTFTVAGGSAFDIAAINITAPSELSAISFVSLTGQVGWSYNLAGSTLQLTADGPQNNKLHDGDSLVLTVQAMVANTNGSSSVTVASWPNKGRNGPSNDIGGGTVVIGSVAQAITFAALSDRTYGDAPFTVSATGGGSGNPVTFTATGDCTATGTDGSTITISGAGSCSVTAHQAAGNGYTAAPDVTRSFNIAKADQTISLDPIATQTYGDPDVTVGASASSGLTVTLSASGACALTGTSLSLDAAGQCTVTANQAGNTNYNPAAEQSVTFTINKAGATLFLGDLGPYAYDGNSHAASATTIPAGLSDVALTYNGSSTAPSDAGSYTVVATLTNDNYEATQVSGTLVINTKHLTGAFTVAGKTYDGSTDAAITDCSLPTGVVSGDDVSLDCSSATASFDSKDAGVRTATLSGAVLSGADAGNYLLDGTGTATATISQKQVTGAIQAADKTYDGSTDAFAVGQALAGKVGSDDVTVDVVSASFADKNVGVDKTVTATIQLLGADAGNYVLSSTTATDQATIFAVQLTGSFTADDKVYDGTNVATTHPNALVGIVGSEDVTLVVSGASFADKNVGQDKVVTAVLSLGGADAGNYELASSSVNTALADITVRSVTGSFTAADKVWDGSTSTTILTWSLAPAVGNTGKISGDDVGLSGGTATFSSPNVGTWTVTGTGFTLSGTDAGNYTLASSTLTTTASISALYRGTGFYQPVDMPTATNPIVWNTIKGGQTVPLKFEIFNAQTGVEQTALTIFGADATAQAKAFSLQSISCSTGGDNPTDPIEVVTTGATSLRYDTSGGQYIQNWKTPTSVNTCWAVSVKTVDGTKVGPAYFKITK